MADQIQEESKPTTSPMPSEVPDIPTETNEPYELVSPTDAYQEAIKSPVYRLSELMFGSLLAAYVLGFITFAALGSNDTNLAKSMADVTNFWDFLALFFQHVVARGPYFFISISFAYVTAGMYVFYHANILTMHNMPTIEGNNVDFLLAMTQAVFFGISMLYPLAFPLCLALILLSSTMRQYFLNRNHTKSFYHNLTKKDWSEGPGFTNRLDAFRGVFNTILGEKKHNYFKGWKSHPWAVIVLAFGLLLVYAGEWLVLSPYFGLSWNRDQIVLWVSLVIFGFAVIYVHLGLGKGSSVLFRNILLSDNRSDISNQKSEIDNRFIDLRNDLASKGYGKAMQLPTSKQKNVGERLDSLVEELKEMRVKYNNERNNS